jgi:hypothetical protein
MAHKLHTVHKDFNFHILGGALPEELLVAGNEFTATKREISNTQGAQTPAKKGELFLHAQCLKVVLDFTHCE